MYLLLGLTLFFAAGAVKDWYFPDDPYGYGSTALTRQPSQRTLETKVVAKAPHKTLATTVSVPELTPRQTKKIEERYGLNLNIDRLLTEVSIPKLPDGGEAAVTLSPDGQTTVTVQPHRPNFLDIGGGFEVGAGMLVDSRLGEGFRLHAAKDLARVGRINIKLEGDLDVLSGETNGRAALLAVYRH